MIFNRFLWFILYDQRSNIIFVWLPALKKHISRFKFLKLFLSSVLMSSSLYARYLMFWLLLCLPLWRWTKDYYNIYVDSIEDLWFYDFRIPLSLELIWNTCSRQDFDFDFKSWRHDTIFPHFSEKRKTDSHQTSCRPRLLTSHDSDLNRNQTEIFLCDQFPLHCRKLASRLVTW